MTEKELYCLGWHLKFYHERYYDDAQTENACIGCKQHDECINPETRTLATYWEMRVALKRELGIDTGAISRWVDD